jgi:hypothetical protein
MIRATTDRNYFVFETDDFSRSVTLFSGEDVSAKNRSVTSPRVEFPLGAQKERVLVSAHHMHNVHTEW